MPQDYLRPLTEVELRRNLTTLLGNGYLGYLPLGRLDDGRGTRKTTTDFYIKNGKVFREQTDCQIMDEFDWGPHYRDPISGILWGIDDRRRAVIGVDQIPLERFHMGYLSDIAKATEMILSKENAPIGI